MRLVNNGISSGLLRRYNLAIPSSRLSSLVHNCEVIVAHDVDLPTEANLLESVSVPNPEKPSLLSYRAREWGPS